MAKLKQMNTLKCVIIEDQLAAQRILKSYIEQLPNLELVGTYIDPTKAILSMETGKIDILFLDIQLPKISGINLLKSLSVKPNVILTTAFSEYAVECFELDVIDYLLKPFSFERFLKAVTKVSKVLGNNKAVIAQSHIFIKEKGVLQKIGVNSILYIESKGDFSLVRTHNSGLIANISLKEATATLGKSFVRCHKSYVVNTNNIEKIIGNQIKSGMYKIPIGRTYKEHLLQHIHLI